MKNKGFTLVELLAVISILAVVAILVAPTMLKAFSNAKKELRKFQVTALEDSVKLYLADIDREVIGYEIKESVNIEGTNYGPNPGEVHEIKGYDFKVYLYKNKADDNYMVPFTVEELVAKGYYNKGCKWAGEVVAGKALAKDQKCSMNKDCTIYGGMDVKMVKANPDDARDTAPSFVVSNKTITKVNKDTCIPQ